MASIIGAHFSRNGIKQFPARVVLSMYSNGLGGDETHPDTITILRDTRIFPSGEAPPDFHTFDPVGSGISWEQYGRYWYSERTGMTIQPNGTNGYRNFKDAWDDGQLADYYTICNEQGGGQGDTPEQKEEIRRNVQRLVDIERAIAYAANADGRKCCVLNLAGGSPGDFQVWKEIVAPFIVEAWEHGGNLYGRHCYAEEFVDSQGNVKPGQPQRVIDELEHLRSIGYGGGMVLTECGLDGGYGVADLTRFTQQVQAWEAALRPYADILIGFCWWEAGASGFNADYTDHLKSLVPYMNNSYLGKWQPAEPQQPPDGGGGTVKHKAIVVKLSQDMTAVEWNTAAAKAFEFRHTMTASHDDMMTVLNGGNEESYVKFSHPERDSAAVGLVEAAGYTWQYLYGAPSVSQPVIVDIVDNLPKHATLKYALRPPTDITTLTIHHTVSPPDRSIESLATYHVTSNGWPGIGYHYVIKADGRIYLTNYLTTKSYHAGSTAAPGDENAISVGIALQGDFTNAPPPQAQLDAARGLVAHLKATLPKVTAVLGHRQMPGASTACPGATWAQWLPYVAGGEIVKPDPPAPPPAQTYDLLTYMRGPDKIQYDNDAKAFTQTYQYRHDANSGWKLIKGGQGQYEYLYADDKYIYRREDTSQGNDKFYVHLTGGKPGAPWVKRHMAVGETVVFSKQVQHYWNNCTYRLPLAAVTDSVRLNAVHSSYTFPGTKKTLSNVIELEWVQGGERYWFAAGYGLVGFTDGPITSEFMGGPLQGRADLPVNVPGCIDLSGRYYA